MILHLANGKCKVCVWRCLAKSPTVFGAEFCWLPGLILLASDCGISWFSLPLSELIPSPQSHRCNDYLHTIDGGLSLLPKVDSPKMIKLGNIMSPYSVQALVQPLCIFQLIDSCPQLRGGSYLLPSYLCKETKIQRSKITCLRPCSVSDITTHQRSLPPSGCRALTQWWLSS